MNKNLHNTTGVHFVSSRIIESIFPPPVPVRTYVRTRQGERDRGAARKGGKVREEGRGTGGEGREKKKGEGERKKRINASSTCMLEQLYTRFVTLFREFFDSSFGTRAN